MFPLFFSGRGRKVAIFLKLALTLLGLGLAGNLAGAALSCALRRLSSLSRWPSVAAGAACLGYLAAGLAVLLGEGTHVVVLPMFHPLGGFSLSLDPLAAFFLCVIGLVGVAASLFGQGYLRHLKGRDLGSVGAWYNLFLLSMALVVTGANAVTFLFFWEGMALSSYFLVVSKKEDPAARQAGFVYLVMAHLGTACLVVLFLWPAAQIHSLAFARMAILWPGLPAGEKTILFLLALVGFGSKAGMVPLHVWLPRAHPAAPSQVSALMSGVMLKVAIYGLLRVVFTFLGVGPVWWGLLVLGLGVVSALLGVLYALMEHDLKRLLAYHSVENIGIILMGVGVALLARSLHLPALLMIGLLAALYHILNHAVFKGLLFLGSGSVAQATGTGDMEKMGGLIHRMPWTAGGFLVGAAAISALPPLNGFASEWLTFQALFGLGYHPVAWWSGLAGTLGVAALALTGGLAAACFIKAYGVTFLALPRSRAAEKAAEVPRSMNLGAGILAASCFVLGLFPSRVAAVLRPAVAALGGPHPPPPGSFFTLASGMGGASLSPLLLAAILVVLLLATRFWSGRMPERLSATWGCGGTLGATSEYNATSFAKPFRIAFAFLFRPVREINSGYEVSPFFRHSLHYRGEIRFLFEEYLYEPVRSFLLELADRFRQVQSGNLRTYLAYLFLTLLALLAVNNKWL